MVNNTCRDKNWKSRDTTALLSSCQILGPFEEQEEFTVEDFHLLEKITLSGSAEKVKAKVKQMGMKPKQYVYIFFLSCCVRKSSSFLFSVTFCLKKKNKQT